MDIDIDDIGNLAIHAQSHTANLRIVFGTNVVNFRIIFAVDPFSVDGEKHPNAIELQAAIRADARLGNAHGVETFDGMKTDVR